MAPDQRDAAAVVSEQPARVEQMTVEQPAAAGSTRRECRWICDTCHSLTHRHYSCGGNCVDCSVLLVEKALHCQKVPNCCDCCVAECSAPTCCGHCSSQTKI